MDYEKDFQAECPFCEHSPIHYRDCSSLFCNDGYTDEYDDDPINFSPGELEVECADCKGTTVEVWCPECGENLSGLSVLSDDDDLA